jgi:hypothetical protein
VCAVGPVSVGHGRLQARLTDRVGGPGPLEEFFFGHKPVAVLDQIGEDIEHLWLGLDYFARIAQLVARQVQFTLLERVDHNP